MYAEYCYHGNKDLKTKIAAANELAQGFEVIVELYGRYYVEDEGKQISYNMISGGGPEVISVQTRWITTSAGRIVPVGWYEGSYDHKFHLEFKED